MKKNRIFLHLILFITFLVLTMPSPHASEEKGNPFFLVKESDNGVCIVKEWIKEGEIKELNAPDIITFLLPLSPGKAGDLIKRDQRGTSLVVRNSGGQLFLRVKRSAGKDREFPPVRIDDLKKYSIRVNITGAGNFKKAFRIEQYETIVDDEGPVIDIFKGTIPLEKGDYSVTLETSEIKEDQAFTGNIPYVFLDDWVTVKGELAGEKEGVFIVDSAATGSAVISKDLLPEGIHIKEMVSVAYTEEGEVRQSGTMIGASGDVDNFLGMAQIPSLRFGSLSLKNVDCSVIREFPDFLKEKNIRGILGLDFLKRAKVVTIENLKSGEEESLIRFGGTSANTQPCDYTIPFTTAGSLLFIDGELNGVPISFLFDTGAGSTFVSHDFMEKNNVGFQTISKDEKGVGGLDGKKAESRTIRVDAFQVGDLVLRDMQIRMADIHAIESLGLKGESALLGMDFIRRFQIVQVDFTKNVIRFWK